MGLFSTWGRDMGLFSMVGGGVGPFNIWGAGVGLFMSWGGRVGPFNTWGGGVGLGATQGGSSRETSPPDSGFVVYIKPKYLQLSRPPVNKTLIIKRPLDQEN